MMALSCEAVKSEDHVNEDEHLKPIRSGLKSVCDRTYEIYFQKTVLSVGLIGHCNVS